MPSRPSTPRSRLPARGPALPARTVLALVLSLAAVTAPAQAAPESREGADTGRAQAALTRVVSEDRDQPPQARAAVQGYPRRTALTEPPADPADASRRLGLTPYHALAPSLNRLQQSSDRVSVEVAGRTVTGRELYLVTLTAPETPAEAQRQQRMRDRVRHDPAQAARDGDLLRGYKAPVLVSANVHGNEWEGTDALLQLVERYATSGDPQVRRTLEHTRIHLLVSINPDGRHGNTRTNAAGFDLNRDLVTGSQPETRAVRDTLVRLQPVLVLDLHGYVNGTLIEPTTPPHGENYELDLLLGHAYPHALAMEQAVLDLGLSAADGVRPPQVPLRDWREGWDGWPPIFIPQYAALHGAVAQTVELPLRVNNGEYDTVAAAELQRRAAVNTEVADAVVTASLRYAVDHREELLAGQIEIFRRGEAGEPQRPVTEDLLPETGPEDVYTTDFPRAYVVPTGEGQRSEAAAARLVEQLLAHDVEVRRADRAFTAGGRTYPEGSYLVDMHQAKRGMANTLLGPGTDISDRVEAMYDIAGWSHALLWGADVHAVPAPAPLRVNTTAVTDVPATGGVEGGGDWALELLDPADVAALNSLLAADVPARLRPDGTVVVPAAAGRDVRWAARQFGVSFVPAGPGEEGVPLDDLTVGAAADPQERWALAEMGFEVRPVSTEALNDGAELDGLDVLYVSTDLAWGRLSAEARAELEGYVAAGGGLVARGAAAVTLNEALDLLDVTGHAGRADANGVVAVQAGDAAGPVGSPAGDHTFVDAPRWFTSLGAGVTAEQRFHPDQVLVSGHWRSRPDGTGGPGQAEGQAVVVSGVTGAAGGAVLLGSDPLFRAHPKGQYALVGRALAWAAAPG